MNTPEILESAARLEGAANSGQSSATLAPEARTPLARHLLRRLLGLDPADTSFVRRRFRGDHSAVRERLERVGATFVRGFNEALEEDRPEPLARRLAQIDLEWQGFAYEGAGMALAILDWLTPWRRDRLSRFLVGPGDAHAYIVVVGAGWISARLPVPPHKVMAPFEPDLRWLALDGYGFHEGFFHWPRTVERQTVPRRLRGYARRAFDLGVGRSLWFVDGADVSLLPKTLSSFAPERQADLWSGLGLAIGYAGGRTREELERLQHAAGPFLAHVGQGVAFASIARERAGNPAPHTELAASVFCGCTAAEAAAITESTRPDFQREHLSADEPAFEVWRQRIQQRLIERGPA